MSNETGSTTNEWLAPTQKNVQLIYGLYLLGFVFGGIPAIIGVVLAYMNRGWPHLQHEAVRFLLTDVFVRPHGCACNPCRVVRRQ